MSDFLNWIRQNFQPERTGERFSLPILKLDYVVTKGFNSEVFPKDGPAYIDVRFQNKFIRVSQDTNLQELYKKAQYFIKSTDEDGKSNLRLNIYQDNNEWGFFWFNDTCYWGLAYHNSYSISPRWVRNYPKFITSLTESRSSCEEETLQFLLEYLSITRKNTEIQLNQAYERFIRSSLESIKQFLDSEAKSLKDERYLPKTNYSIIGSYEEDDSFSKIQIDEPLRVFTGSGVHIRPRQSTTKKFSKAITEEFLEDEDILLVPSKQILNWPQSGILELAPNFTLNRRKQEAINHLEEAGMIHLQRLLDLLIRPQALPETDPIDVVNIKDIFQKDNKESRDQCLAIDKAFGSPDICLIQGPPGTGKTEVICEMVLQVIRKGGRVLLTSPTNVAVDNVLMRIHDEKNVRPIRIGRINRVFAKLKKYMLSEQEKRWTAFTEQFRPNNKNNKNILQNIQTNFFKKLKEEHQNEIRSIIIDQANLVCGTCIGVVNLEFTEFSLDNPFDLMIVDEASKATLLEFLVPAIRAKRWILVGDHRQLAPYVSDIELKVYLQRFLEKSGLITKTEPVGKETYDTDENGTRDYSKHGKFNVKVEEIMKYIRRYHEEFHNLEQEYSDVYLEKILQIFNFRKKESNNFIQMVEYSLGSSFHFFWKRVDDSRKAYLPYQHRMPLEIANFLNKEIYGNMFKTSNSAELHGYLISLNKRYFTNNPNSPTVFIETSNQTNRHERRNKDKPWDITNKLEAEITCLLVKEICGLFPLKSLHNGMKQEKYAKETSFRIGIITFYVYQSRLINRMLSSLKFLEKNDRWSFKHIEKDIEIRVSIVDRFQGQEQEVIILNMVRSNKYNHPGFLTNVQRMNVGLSRARHNMFIIGDRYFFRNLMSKDKRGKYYRSFLHPSKILVSLAEYYWQNKWITQYKTDQNRSKNNIKIKNISPRFHTLVKFYSIYPEERKKGLSFDWIISELAKKIPNWKAELNVKKLAEYVHQAQNEGIVTITTTKSKKIVHLNVGLILENDYEEKKEGK